MTEKFGIYFQTKRGRRFRCEEEETTGKVFVPFIALSLRLILAKKFRNIQKSSQLRSLEPLLRKASVVNEATREVSRKPATYWQAFPKSVESAIKTIGIKIPSE